jgi:hypothetical protein
MSASRHVPHAGRSCPAGRTAGLPSQSTAIRNSLSRKGLHDGLGLRVVALPLLWEEVRHDSWELHEASRSTHCQPCDIRGGPRSTGVAVGCSGQPSSAARDVPHLDRRSSSGAPARANGLCDGHPQASDECARGVRQRAGRCGAWIRTSASRTIPDAGPESLRCPWQPAFARGRRPRGAAAARGAGPPAYRAAARGRGKAYASRSTANAARNSSEQRAAPASARGEISVAATWSLLLDASTEVALRA